MRLSGVLLVLLVVSNAAWFFFGRGVPEPVVPVAPPVDRRPESAVADPGPRREEARVAHDRAVEPAGPCPGGGDPHAEREALRERWIRDACQIRDARLRASTLDEIRRALASEEPDRVRPALEACLRIEESMKLDEREWDPLFPPLLRSRDGEVVRVALGIWGANLDGEPDYSLLAELSRHPSPGVRAAAAEWLAGDKGHPEPLLALLDDPDPDVVRTAIRALSRSWGETVPARLLEKARSGGTATRIVAVESLGGGMLNRPEVVAEMLRLVEDPDPKVRDAVLTVFYEKHERLGGHRDEIADASVRLLGAAEDPDAAAGAVWMLDFFGSERHLPALERYSRNPLITKSSRDSARKAIETIRGR